MRLPLSLPPDLRAYFTAHPEVSISALADSTLRREFSLPERRKPVKTIVLCLSDEVAALLPNGPGRKNAIVEALRKGIWTAHVKEGS